MKTILQSPSLVLREIAAPVEKNLFGTVALNTIVAEMIEALESQDDGVAIAAPQIGISKQIFVVSKRTMKGWRDHRVFVNPKIIRIGKTKKAMTEGCLSVRYKYGTTFRAETATVRAQNKEGYEFQLSGRGLLAQIFQHEIDHLNGILFIDHAKEIVEIPPTTTASS